MILSSRVMLDMIDHELLLIASEGLKRRVFEVSLADLQKDEDHAYKKIRLREEDIQGRNVLINFWTLIKAHVDVKTEDNYSFRLFCIAFTKRRANQVKRTYYAQSNQIHQKMREIMINYIGREIQKATSSIFPLQNASFYSVLFSFLSKCCRDLDQVSCGIKLAKCSPVIM
ncbi:hypothetical protein K2173_015472 [Erythroxylum novogranatense]|uniref:Uncharacterized protein n=1 Tax=Erythroxylum novogranatense TaxID=1862640 RepID=A0AAV8SRU0_9ROSI|nr:hypothetical protein K2173_015472 [Erythroxylum novogranatense]